MNEQNLRVSFRSEESATHARITIWVNGANAGCLTVRRGAEESVLGVIEMALRKIPGVRCDRVHDSLDSHIHSV